MGLYCPVTSLHRSGVGRESIRRDTTSDRPAWPTQGSLRTGDGGDGTVEPSSKLSSNNWDIATVHLLNRFASDLALMLRRPPRLQYAALCYRVRMDGSLEILLITSRDTGRWVVPKGWPMKGKRAYEVAAREAFEEAGVRGSCQRRPLGHYFYRKRMDGGFTIPCKVQIYTLEVTRLLRDFPEKDERKRVWFGYREAARRVVEPSLRKQILRFGTLYLVR